MSERPRFLWTDLETTGLDPEVGEVLEIAMIVTEPDLSEVARFHRVFPARGAEHAIAAMDPVVREMHTVSGLLADCVLADDDRIRAWADVYAFVLEHGGERPILAGSSIHFDRAWLQEHARPLLDVIHYRMLDVSGIRELLRSIGREVPERAEKPHRAMPDAEASLSLARWFAAGFQNAVFPDSLP